MLSRLRLPRRPIADDMAAPDPGADLGPAVLAFLAAQGVPTAPAYYALVHEALADRTSIAAHAIAEAVHAHGPLGRDGADRILAGLAGPSPEQSAAADAENQERLRHQTLHLADLAADAAAATGQFGRDLSAGLEGLDRGVHSVSAMLTAMIDRTCATERQLAAAAEQIEQLRDEVAEARSDAMRDELTGLRNRRGVTAHVAAIADRRARTLAICDIDAFKCVNDSHGHEVGDRVLKVVAAALAEGCAPNLVGRWGGEEFILVLDEANPARAAEIVDSVRLSLCARNLRVRETGESLGRVTFSAGIAAFPAGGFDAALRTADALLYDAKLAGRNRVAIEAVPAKAA